MNQGVAVIAAVADKQTGETEEGEGEREKQEEAEEEEDNNGDSTQSH